MIEKSHEELLICSGEDKMFFDNVVSFLPKRLGFAGNYLDKYGIEIPFGSEAHIVQHFRRTIELIKPKKIFEIGFNLGYSSALFLMLDDDVKVCSVDISDKEETMTAALILKNRHPERFSFFCLKYKGVLPIDYDLIFIDGAHDEESVVKDIQFSLNCKIPYILFDDYYSRYGEVAKAIARFPELELMEDMDNLRLYKTESWEIH